MCQGSSGPPSSASGGAKGNGCCILVKYEKRDREKQLKMTGAGKTGTPALGFSPESQGYLILLFIVQLLGIGIWLPDKWVHQHQEGHVE